MRNQPLILVILAMLGLSGLLVVTGGPGQKGQPPTATETAKVGGASPASGDTWEPCERAQVYGPLCRYFGVESVEEAQRRFRLADSRVVIATVPDPLDSELGFSFDQRLETLRMAAIAAGYQPDRFYLPWRTPAKERGAADGAAGLDVTATLSENELKLLSPAQGVSPPAHRVSPGAQLFRGPAASGGDDPYAQSLLLLLLVGETPTFGADPRAVAQALDIAGALMSPDRNRDDRGPVLPVVGPNFSGAVEPLRKASLGWLGKLSPYRLRFVSGTATNSAQLLRLAMCTLSDRVCWEQEYSALVPLACVNEVASFADSTERTISELFEFLDARVPRGANVALLHEADTAYGEGVADVRGRGELTLLPFPLHVSQLWTAYLQQNRSGVDPAQLDPAAKRALSLIPEGPPNPIDVPPSFFPRTGANVAERVLSNLLSRVSSRTPVDFVGIMGSNVADAIFLSRLVREHLPEALLFTVGGGVLLTHPQYTSSLYGLWMVSSSSALVLDPLNGTGHMRWRQLPTTSDAGLYHAFLSAICPMRPGATEGVCSPDSGELPHWTPSTAPDGTGPVYLTAVGRDALWLVDLRSRGQDGWEIPNEAAYVLGHPGAFAPLLLAFSLFALYACGAYAWSRPGSPSFAMAGTVAWLGHTHAMRRGLGLPAIAFFLGLLAACAYPTALWALRLTWSRWYDAALIWVCIAASLIVLLTTARVMWSEWAAEKRPLVALTIGIAVIASAAIILAGIAAVRHGLGSWGALLLTQRAVTLTSGLSPAVPWSFLSVASLLLAHAGLRRRRLLQKSQALRHSMKFADGLPDLDRLVDGVRNTLDPAQPASLRDFATARWIAAAAAFVFTLGLLLRWRIVTMESPAFGDALTLALPVLYAGAAYLTASAFALWLRLQRLLRALAWGPLADAFDRVPQEFARTLGLRWSSEPGAASELRYDLDQVSMLCNLAVREADTGGGVPCPVSGLVGWPATRAAIEGDLAAAAGKRRWTFAYETPAQTLLSTLAGGLLRDFLVERWHEEPVLEGTATVEPGKLEFEKRGAPVVDLVTGYRRRPVPLLRLAEEFVAVEITRFIGYVFVHLKSLLASAIWVVLLLLLAAGSYPFRPQHLLIQWLGLGFGGLMAFATSLIVLTDRNEVLSRIANRTPNKLDFDATFFAQILTYIVLPIAALLATQFPALSGPLSSLLGGLGSG